MAKKGDQPISPWIVVFSDETVLQEFHSIPIDLQASLAHVIEMIQDLGLISVGMPYVKHVEEELWELRARGKSGIARGLYVTRSERRIFILRVIHKKTQKLRKSDLDIARERARRIPG